MFEQSLDRSRSRRGIARRLRTRRRRSRGGGGALTVIVLAAALSAPLAVAERGSFAAAGLLKTGSRNAAVAELQRALGVRETGYYGPLTRAAVRRFQAAHGLTVDGIVGPQTGAALGLEPAAATNATASAPSADAAAVLGRIAACESNGDPTAVSRDGRYHGKYQFSRATWRAMGGKGDPAKAPEAEQDRRAAALLARSGTAPWPRCA